MTDNVITFPGSENTPSAILRQALSEAENMDAVMVFSIMADGDIDLSASGVKISDLCIAAARLQGHAISACQALESLCDDDGI